MRPRLRSGALPATAAGLVLLAAGCGGTAQLHANAHHARSGRTPGAGTAGAGASGTPQAPAVSPAPAHPAPAPHPPGGGLPAPGPTGVAAPPADVGVIRRWSTALRQGRLDAAAAYFALPSSFINGDGSGVISVVTIRDRREAWLASASLPCGATFISADQRGRYVNALFRLGGRRGPGGSNCGSGAGQTARTNFVISGGKILAWIRAPDDPGDNSGGGGGAPAPAPAPGSQSVPVV